MCVKGVELNAYLDTVLCAMLNRRGLIGLDLMCNQKQRCDVCCACNVEEAELNGVNGFNG